MVNSLGCFLEGEGNTNKRMERCDRDKKGAVRGYSIKLISTVDNERFFFLSLIFIYLFGCAGSLLQHVGSSLQHLGFCFLVAACRI